VGQHDNRKRPLRYGGVQACGRALENLVAAELEVTVGSVCRVPILNINNFASFRIEYLIGCKPGCLVFPGIDHHG
jgi:hypothetical protein